MAATRLAPAPAPRFEAIFEAATARRYGRRQDNRPVWTEDQALLRRNAATARGVILLLALSHASAVAAAEPVSTAKATVRVLQPVSASKNQWDRPDTRHKREVLVKEADGRITRMRLIENE